MPHYKLYYFDARGLGEVIRQLFVLADVDFEDHRLDRKEFQKLKPSLPSGQVPILEIDHGKLILSQSAAIGRYLARKFGFSGKTPEEEAQVDAIIDLFKDFMNTFRKYGFAVFQGQMEEDTKRIKQEIVQPAARFYFSCLNKILEANSKHSNFLVGTSLTWADLQIADNLTSLKNDSLFVDSDQPRLAEFHKNILSIPKLKAYLEKRRFTLV